MKDVRGKKSLLTSLITGVLQLEARDRRLADVLEQTKTLRNMSVSRTAGANTWPAGALTPYIHDEQRKAQASLVNLGSVHKIEERPDGSSRWEVSAKISGSCVPLINPPCCCRLNECILQLDSPVLVLRGLLTRASCYRAIGVVHVLVARPRHGKQFAFTA